MTRADQELAAFLAYASAEDTAATLPRLSTATRLGLLRYGGTPSPALAAWATGHGTPDEHAALARNSAAGRDTLARLAAVADGPAQALVYVHPQTTAGLRRTMLDADPLPAALRDLVLGTPRSRRVLGPALSCRHPELAAHARAHIRGPGGSTPAETPRELYEWLSRTSGDSARSRRRARGRLAAFPVHTWGADAWAELTALHSAGLLDERACTALVELPECPLPTALALVRTRMPDGGTGYVVAAGLRAGTFTARELVRETPYAAHLLRTLETAERAYENEIRPHDLAEIHRELTDLAHRDIGAEPAVWRALLELLHDEFTGPLPELAAAARRLAETAPRVPRRPWPVPGESSSSPFAHLLRFADQAAVPGIVAALDPHDLAEFAHYEVPHGPTDAMTDAFLDRAGPALAELFLHRQWFRGNVLHQVVRRDDPDLNAALVTGRGIPAAAWIAIASGRPHTPGRSTPVPLAAGTAAALRDRVGDKIGNLRFAVRTRDPDLISEALHLADPGLSPGHQVIGCRRLLELGRADDVRALARPHGPLDPLLATRIRNTPAAADPAAPTDPATPTASTASTALAETLARTERDLLRHELAHGAHDQTGGLLDDEDLPWAEVAAAVRRAELPWQVAFALARRPDLPPDVAVAMLEHGAPDAYAAPTLAQSSRPAALTALRRLPAVPAVNAVGPLEESRAWPLHCVAEGLISAAELYAQGRPARSVLLLGRAFPDRLAGLRAILGAEISRHCAGSSDTWAVAAALLGGFPGTVPDLLGVAAAAAAPAAAGTGAAPVRPARPVGDGGT
ncbi:hypothetical protein [Yinghuangia soli]|uniref:Uncharacterized protein n=1 Tax=Yinghuangia soli TaxID=2908204 RepID=A0AA41Q9X9_9ACTN|nr:hypothetical protein [Yinghuangia soli]MCF2532902.1 hypothetical protein [Yinghuangia soli]